MPRFLGCILHSIAAFKVINVEPQLLYGVGSAMVTGTHVLYSVQYIHTYL